VLEVRGKAKENVVPFPSLLSTEMVPPWASTSLLQMANPNPVPLGFVVKNGVKSFPMFSFEIP
jgi:hypothetical protein